jgi:hypothetical protein
METRFAKVNISRKAVGMLKVKELRKKEKNPTTKEITISRSMGAGSMITKELDAMRTEIKPRYSAFDRSFFMLID